MAIKVADLNRLMDNARVRLPGALDGAIQLEIYNVLNDFLQRTSIWTEDVNFAVVSTLVAGDTIPIAASAGTINQLMAVKDSSGFQRNMGMAVPGTLEIIDVPSTAETWTATVALTCGDPLTSAGNPVIPDWILTKYHSGILSGVLGRMFSQAAKPYSSDKLSILHTREFNAVAAQGNADASHKNVYRGQAWRFPQAFSVGRRH